MKGKRKKRKLILSESIYLIPAFFMKCEKQQLTETTCNLFLFKHFVREVQDGDIKSLTEKGSRIDLRTLNRTPNAVPKQILKLKSVLYMKKNQNNIKDKTKNSEQKWPNTKNINNHQTQPLICIVRFCIHHKYI